MGNGRNYSGYLKFTHLFKFSQKFLVTRFFDSVDPPKVSSGSTPVSEPLTANEMTYIEKAIMEIIKELARTRKENLRHWNFSRSWTRDSAIDS